MVDEIEDEKRAFRAEIRERRQLLSDAQRDQAATGIASQLHALVERYDASSITCYLSAYSEPGTRQFVQDAVTSGIRVLLPVTRADGLLDWAVATAEGEELEGLFGMPEPDGELLGPMAADEVDLLIIPAAAVGNDGIRLGWGRGYFDKTLGSMEKTPPVYAVLYDSEVLEEVPSEPHDQPVTGVVTPSQTIDLVTDSSDTTNTPTER